MRLAKFGALLLFGVAALFGIVLAINPADQNSSPDSVVGYLRDSECVYRFHEVLKPLSNGCVEACVRGGASLVILTRQEQVFHPISAEMPAREIRSKLLPYVGKLVKVSGTIYSRGGSKAIAVERIEEIKE